MKQDYRTAVSSSIVHILLLVIEQTVCRRVRRKGNAVNKLLRSCRPKIELVVVTAQNLLSRTVAAKAHNIVVTEETVPIDEVCRAPDRLLLFLGSSNFFFV